MSDRILDLKSLLASAMVIQSDKWQDANRTGDWNAFRLAGRIVDEYRERLVKFDPDMLTITLSAWIEDREQVAEGFNCYDVARFLMADLAVQGVPVDRIMNDSESGAVFIYAPERYRENLKAAVARFSGVSGEVSESVEAISLELSNWEKAREYMNAEGS